MQFLIKRTYSTIKKPSLLGVVGAGQMGLGIALVSALKAKTPVLLVDSNSEQVQKGMKYMDFLLSKDVLKGKITESEKKDALSLVNTSDTLSDFENVDFVIEAVSENPALKRQIFSELCKITPKHAILATNTSSISITKIASSTKRPEKLVEIIPGLATSNETLVATLKFAKEMGKITTQSNDTPGFIANRVLMPYINEACYVLQEGIATREDIDTTMKLGTNVPMGPLTLADFIGLDTCLAIMKVLHLQLGDSKYRPSPLLAKVCR
ncbi:hypothetical protein HK099_006726 [Clydaea vesicula]|uniref:3-hydroxybutyryl-CoA dehydrogenase n=1 Tax=Clydaea vesicula TaxID=447962 RepID=A0AAD5U811_9FUNG|nr:hypothetical protein HK099_006726 [Clydaea vesicula]